MIPVAADRLPGLLGHELRNPIASAMTGAMLARDMVDEGDPRAAVLDGVLADLDRTTALIDGWLALARGAAARRLRIDVDGLLSRVAGRHGVQLVAGSGAAVRGDAAMLERALDNLVENARQAGARHVRLAAQTLGEQVVLHVEDDGAGVPKDGAGRLFEAGWSGRGGTGLGLYAVAATVAAHGGAVGCQALPRGTRFSITLPLDASLTATA